MLAVVLSMLACVFAALCYAEFASLIPVAGSAYNYSYATLGEIFAWVVGWDLVLEYVVGCIAVAIGWSGYFVNIMKAIGIDLPVWCTAAPGTVPGAVINLPAVFINMLTATRWHKKQRQIHYHSGLYQGPCNMRLPCRGFSHVNSETGRLSYPLDLKA
jgi:amino acid transporter